MAQKFLFIYHTILRTYYIHTDNNLIGPATHHHNHYLFGYSSKTEAWRSLFGQGFELSDQTSFNYATIVTITAVMPFLI